MLWQSRYTVCKDLACSNTWFDSTSERKTEDVPILPKARVPLPDCKG